jgi:Protein of unknown function (DUF2628)
MLIYTVHEPARPAHSLEQRAEDVVFIREGFTGWGFLFGPLWLLFNGLWLELGLALLLSAGAAGVLTGLGLNQDQASQIAMLSLMLIVGFEGNSLRQWRLERKGYVFLASVAGKSFEECERRFFDAWLPAVAKPKAAPAPQPASSTGTHSWGDWPGPGAVGTLPGGIV